MTTETSPSRVQRVRHDIKRRHVQVLRVDTLSPHLRSITFGGDELADFVSASFDDHVKLMFDAQGNQEPVRRDYTPRHHDAARRELTLEFVLHGEGPAAAWAAQAAPGQQVSIGGPRGSLIIPLDYDWHLLVGDETALPAITRRLEEGDGYAWCAAEAKVSAEARRVLVQDKGHDRHAIRAAAYWKHGAVAHHENLEA